VLIGDKQNDFKLQFDCTLHVVDIKDVY